MRRVAIACVALLGLAVPQARGFELLRTNDDPCSSAQNLFWRDGHVAVSESRLPDPQRGIAEQARTTWNNSLGRFRFDLSGGAACSRDGVVALDLTDTPCGLSNFGDALAITRSVWNANGELVDADVAFNSNTYIVDDDAAFLHVALHELGHALGLAHSDACGDSGAGTLMKAVLGNNPLDAPQQDDVAGGEAIYGSGGGGGNGAVPEGANSCAISPVAHARGAYPLLGAALLFALRRRRP